MSFFIKNKGVKGQAKKGKVRKQTGEAPKGPPNKRSKYVGMNEEIESDSDIEPDDDTLPKRSEGYISSESDEETAQEKKLRLAKQYLKQIELEERDERVDNEVDTDVVSKRLKEDILEQGGKLQRKEADNLAVPCDEDVILFRGHQLSVTCVVISPDTQFIYSGSKDCSIIKWSLRDRKKVKVIHGGRKGTEKKHIGHTGHILSMAISSDGKFLATGDINKLIHIWDARSMELLHTFRGHRDSVSGLTFRKDTHQLYSCSFDRSVKIWHVDERAYVETLFGHQDKITGIDSLSRERAITSGSRDNSIRIWKIIEESQLVFNAHTMCSVDCVALINESYFISGNDDNSISLWGVMKKKPLCTLKNAHGCQASEGSVDNSHKENWITAVAAKQNSDIVASAGSRDGCVRFWKCSSDYKKLEPIISVSVAGFVNCLKFSNNGQYLIGGVGQEHRLGRWWSDKKAKNGIVIIPLNINC
ncbi:pre-rRNA processing protein [Mactra antiquata]